MKHESSISVLKKYNGRNELFFPTLFVVVFIYFSINWHYWFLCIINGYAIVSWLFSSVLFCIIMCSMFLKGDLRIQFKNIKTINMALACYVIFGLITILRNESQFYTIGVTAFGMFAPLIIYISIVLCLKNNRDIERILKVLFFVGLVFCLYFVYIHFVIGPEYFNVPPMKLTSLFSDKIIEFDLAGNEYFLDSEGNNARLAFPGLGCTPFAVTMCPLVLLGFYYAINSKGHLRFFYYIASAIMVFCLTKTGSRMPLIALGAGVLPFVWYMRKRLGTVIVILFIIASIGLLNIYMSEYMNTRFAHVADASDHLDMTETLSFLSMKTILFGVGNTYYLSEVRIPEHNRFLHTLITSGIVGFLPYIGFVVVLIITIRKPFLKSLKRDSSSNNIGILFYAIVIVTALNLFNRAQDDIYWLVFGLAAAWLRNSAYEEVPGSKGKGFCLSP